MYLNIQIIKSKHIMIITCNRSPTGTDIKQPIDSSTN